MAERQSTGVSPNNHHEHGGRSAPTPPSAEQLLSPGQQALGAAFLLCAAVGLALRTSATLTVLVGLCIVFYALFAALKLFVSVAGRGYRPLDLVPLRSTDPGLPRYAILLPVHKEANVLRHLIARIGRLDYPTRQLRVFLLIEEDDEETLEAARDLGLRFHGDRSYTYFEPLAHITVVVIPPGGPKTKPNALNVAMELVVAHGCTLCTIYDAEDRPDPDQLLKAVGTFRLAPPEVACLQAELAFWNDDTNWVTALYWIGYKIHFRRFLPGLARLGLPIPLGGTSNHFRVDALLDIALTPGGNVWDPHNLTEDADLGARLVTGGYRIELLNSVTLEEAPSSKRIVDKQQRRWKGGYLQTGLVHTRRPISTARRMGPVKWCCFNLMMLGTPLSLLLNPIFLSLTCAFFITRAEVISRLFPTAIYYPALILLVLGNFSLLFELVQTCLEEAELTRGRFGLLKHMLLAQVLWLWMSRSTYIAVFELFTGKRGWHKTPHGHEIADDEFDLVDVFHRPAAALPLPAPAADALILVGPEQW
jgi:glycosyltransferase XagB